MLIVYKLVYKIIYMEYLIIVIAYVIIAVTRNERVSMRYTKTKPQ